VRNTRHFLDCASTILYWIFLAIVGADAISIDEKAHQLLQLVIMKIDKQVHFLGCKTPQGQYFVMKAPPLETQKADWFSLGKPIGYGYVACYLIRIIDFE